MRCKERVRSGERCHKTAIEDSQYCQIHDSKYAEVFSQARKAGLQSRIKAKKCCGKCKTRSKSAVLSFMNKFTKKNLRVKRCHDGSIGIFIKVFPK